MQDAWKEDSRWIPVHHDMTKNSVKENLAIVDQRPARCFVSYYDKKRKKWQKHWFVGFANIMESKTWCVVYETEQTEEGKICKYAFNGEEEDSMWIKMWM